MQGFAPVSDVERLRTRRWDAIVLGSGIASLVAAARIGAAGHRVLVVEEAAARAQHPALREPFFLGGSRDGGVLDACLRTLNVPLIEQRRIAPERLAYQVVSSKLRLDVGSVALTSDELATWGLSSAEQAGALCRALVESTEAERRAMLASAVVRTGRRLGAPRSGATGSHIRGLPAEAAEPTPELQPILEAQVTAMTNIATASPTPEARSRLLGGALVGAAGFSDGPPWLVELLRQRVEAAYGEFRSVSGAFALVSSDAQPGVSIEATRELWLGRMLVVGAGLGGLRERFAPNDVPQCLEHDRPVRRRIGVHLRIARDILPRGMCPRVILLDEHGRGGPQDDVIALSAYAPARGAEHIDLVARMRVAPDADVGAAEDAIEARVRALMPFSDGHLERATERRPVWDDDGWLEDPAPGSGWPAEVDLKVSSRPSVYRLGRAGVGGLGVEGDLLLGWRAGDALAAELG